MNEETKVIDEIMNEEVFDTTEPIEESGEGLFGLLLLGAVSVGAGVTAWWYKKSGKLNERRIKKLEKQGYVVTKPELIEEEVETVEIETENE